MATQVLDDDTHVERPGLRWRRWARWIAAGTVVVLLIAWLWIGNHPAVSPGPLSGTGPGTRVANDGLGNTRFVVEHPEAELVLSIRNSGVVPFTVRGHPEDSPGPISLDMRFGPTDVTGLEQLQQGSRQVTLRPGEERAVLLGVHVDRCFASMSGGYVSIPVQVQVRQLGITTTQELSTRQELGGLYFPVDAFQKINRPTDCPGLP